MLFDAFKGTPTFNLAMRSSGWGVAPESIIFGSLSQVSMLFCLGGHYLLLTMLLLLHLCHSCTLIPVCLQEMTLFKGGKGLVIEPGAVMSTHYIQSGRLFYVPVT